MNYVDITVPYRIVSASARRSVAAMQKKLPIVLFYIVTLGPSYAAEKTTISYSSRTYALLPAQVAAEAILQAKGLDLREVQFVTLGADEPVRVEILKKGLNASALNVSTAL